MYIHTYSCNNNKRMKQPCPELENKSKGKYMHRGEERKKS